MKPRKDRRPVPAKPKNFDAAIKGVKTGGYDLDAYNAEAFEEYNTKALVPCDGCGRTFLPDSLLKHIKSCKGGGSGKGSPARSPGKAGAGGGGGALGKVGGGQMNKIKKPEPNAVPVRPKTLMCYICGREYGSASLEIHLKTCIKKFETAQMQKPKHERKPLP